MCVKAFASAIASGSLAKLSTLLLIDNKIDDAGVQALAGAIASGSLGNLETLGLGGRASARLPPVVARVANEREGDEDEDGLERGVHW